MMNKENETCLEPWLDSFNLVIKKKQFASQVKAIMAWCQPRQTPAGAFRAVTGENQKQATTKWAVVLFALSTG